MRRFLMHWLVAAIALYAAVRLVPGISYDGAWETLAVMALIFGFVNAIVRPILIVLTCPLQILTLGLFSLVLNGAMLLLATNLARGLGVAFHVDGFFAALVGALVFAVVSLVLNALLGEDDHRRRRRHQR
jgi:putative membrane protein